MKRVHLFEFEDQEWFPTFLRNYLTDFLQFLSNKSKLYQPILPLLTQKLKEDKANTIIDLASGGGGGLLWLNQELKKEIPTLNIVLTDYYPNVAAFERTRQLADNFEYIPTPVDARQVPPHLQGFRTQFLSFHHFRPEDAAQILQNAIDKRASIGVFEAQDRSIPSIMAMIFSPITVLLVTPFIRPFSFRRLLFTYLLPIIPLFVLWDGVVSCFRTYSIEEMEALVATLSNTSTYNWEIGEKKGKAHKILYLIGTPKTVV